MKVIFKNKDTGEYFNWSFNLRSNNIDDASIFDTSSEYYKWFIDNLGYIYKETTYSKEIQKLRIIKLKTLDNFS